MIYQRKSTLVLFLICLLLFSSCTSILSSDVTLEVNKGEKWEIVIQATFSRDETMISDALMAETFNQMVQDAHTEGLESEWEKLPSDANGNDVYKITLGGEGYDLLNDQLGTDLIVPDESSEDNVYRFYVPGGGFFGLDAPESSFTLEGGKILSSNGIKINNKTVRWENHSGPMEATLTETSGNAWITFFVILIVIGAVTFLILRLTGTKISSLRSNLSPTHAGIYHDAGLSSPAGGKFCPHCGGAIPAEASFCPQCGKPRE